MNLYSPLSLCKITINNVLKNCKKNSIKNSTTIQQEIDKLQVPDEIKNIIKKRYHFYVKFFK